MTFLEVRNIITQRLEQYLGIPVILGDQATPPPDNYPFCYYSVTTPYAPTGAMGNYEQTEIPSTTKLTTTRTEQPTATLSLIFCSINRWSKDENGADTEPYIYGEDEAQSLAERAQGFFLHAEYDILSNLGIVVVDVTNTTNRTTLVVDEAARRYGFDVRIRYTRVDSRTDETVGSVTTSETKE
ncbi:LIC_12616 family protein [Desulfitobacterium sp.]|uniref:phage neck terminator protein n=1 Tax=Desulfitobacterium sp. TaxID=49981 RepID=UPI002B1ECFCA|nr:hypothetical protein [Desulfitobacterium sp.]MEA4901856.1 hypothetical protein [Desulfitobacterium sp.]